MYRTAAVLGGLALLLTSVDLSAQTRPDFSGSWTMVAPAGGAPGGAGAPGGGGGGRAGGGAPPAGAPAAGAPAGAPGGGGGRAGGGGGRGGGMGLGQAAVLTQTAATLTVVRTLGGMEIRSVYNLDGSPSSNTMNFGGQSVAQVSTATWDGAKLVIRTPAAGGGAGETVMALSLNPQGQLVLETTAPGRGGGAPTTTTLTYTK